MCFVGESLYDMPYKPLSKHWLEAATVILAAGTRNALSGSPAVSPHSGPIQFDYRVLMLQRSGKSRFMPNVKVFPGGVVDASDFSEEWLEVFKSAGQENFDKLTQAEVHAGRSPMFTAERDSPVPNKVGYRICAIRETFEESGVLLVRPWARGPAVWPLPPAQLAGWRKRVDGNAREFLRLCNECRCVPDVWSLYEWSNWLTPVIPTSLNRRRYDTAFFIRCLDYVPAAAQDDREVVKAQWLTPAEVLHDFRQEKHIVAPPQTYELSRLCQVPRLTDLDRFSRDRGAKGCERWLPVILSCEDGRVEVLPGDDLYPNPPTPETFQGYHTKNTVEQLRLATTNVHRNEYDTPFNLADTYCNIPPKFGHLSPKQNVYDFVGQIHSKL